MQVRFSRKMLCFLTVVATAVLVSTNVPAAPISGSWEGDTILADSGFQHGAGGILTEEIIDVEGEPGNKALRIDVFVGNVLHFINFEEWEDADVGMPCVLELIWATDVPAHEGSDGFGVSTIDDFIRIKSIKDALLIGGDLGMQPLENQLENFDGEQLHKVTVEWTTEIGGSEFTISVNDTVLQDDHVGDDGPIFHQADQGQDLRFEVREEGYHIIDRIAWGLNGGELPPSGTAVEPSDKLATTWASIKSLY
jgi:hypothetical protein